MLVEFHVLVQVGGGIVHRSRSRNREKGENKIAMVVHRERYPFSSGRRLLLLETMIVCRCLTHTQSFPCVFLRALRCLSPLAVTSPFWYHLRADIIVSSSVKILVYPVVLSQRYFLQWLNRKCVGTDSVVITHFNHCRSIVRYRYTYATNTVIAFWELNTKGMHFGQILVGHQATVQEFDRDCEVSWSSSPLVNIFTFVSVHLCLSAF